MVGFRVCVWVCESVCGCLRCMGVCVCERALSVGVFGSEYALVCMSVKLL